MDAAHLDASLHTLETYHGARVPDGAWIVLRVDGRSVSGFTARRFTKPLDPVFNDCMTDAA